MKVLPENGSNVKLVELPEVLPNVPESHRSFGKDIIGIRVQILQLFGCLEPVAQHGQASRPGVLLNAVQKYTLELDTVNNMQSINYIF